MTAVASPIAERSVHISRATTTAAAACAAVAAVVHAGAVPEHLAEWPVAGVLFLMISLGQAALAGLLYVGGPGARSLVAAVWANTAVVVLYVVSRTAGVPFEPEGHVHAHAAPLGGATQQVGPVELVTLGAEVVLVALLVTMLSPRTSRRTSTLLMLTGVVLWTSSALGLLG